jgi:ATP-dependent Clp protease ATP-binding subunit ClpA
MPNKMERYSKHARRVLSLAQEEAERLQHSYIGTEHILIGLMREEGGVAGRVLRDLGLDGRRVEELVERMTRAGQRSTSARLDLSPGTKRVLELAVDEARRLGHHYIGTEHLLLGLVRESQGVAIEVFKRLNVSPEEVRRQTRKVLQARQPQTVTPQGKITLEQYPNLAGEVVAAATLAAQELRHGYLGSWHLLLALVRDSGIAGRVLRELQVTAQPIEEVLMNEPIFMPAINVPYHVMPSVQNTLELAIDEARTRKHKYVRSEDLLLGLLRQNPGMFAQLNVTPDAIRAKVEQILKEQPPPSSEQQEDPEQPSQ